MAAWPPSRAMVLRLGGLPAAACNADAREVVAVHVGANCIELPGHGFTGGEAVRFRTVNGSLPIPLDATTWYEVEASSDPDFFSLAGVTLVGAGSGKLSCLENIGAKVDEFIAARVSWLEARAKAYASPWTAAPEWAPQLLGVLVAFDLTKWLRTANARFPVEDIRKAYDEAQAFIKEHLDKGEPMAVGQHPTDATPAVAEMGALLVELDGRGFLESPEDYRA